MDGFVLWEAMALWELGRKDGGVALACFVGFMYRSTPCGCAGHGV